MNDPHLNAAQGHAPVASPDPAVTPPADRHDTSTPQGTRNWTTDLTDAVRASLLDAMNHDFPVRAADIHTALSRTHADLNVQTVTRWLHVLQDEELIRADKSGLSTHWTLRKAPDAGLIRRDWQDRLTRYLEGRRELGSIVARALNLPLAEVNATLETLRQEGVIKGTSIGHAVIYGSEARLKRWTDPDRAANVRPSPEAQLQAFLRTLPDERPRTRPSAMTLRERAKQDDAEVKAHKAQDKQDRAVLRAEDRRKKKEEQNQRAEQDRQERAVLQAEERRKKKEAKQQQAAQDRQERAVLRAEERRKKKEAKQQRAAQDRQNRAVLKDEARRQKTEAKRQQAEQDRQERAVLRTEDRRKKKEAKQQQAEQDRQERAVLRTEDRRQKKEEQDRRAAQDRPAAPHVPNGHWLDFKGVMHTYGWTVTAIYKAHHAGTITGEIMHGKLHFDPDSIERHIARKAQELSDALNEVQARNLVSVTNLALDTGLHKSTVTEWMDRHRVTPVRLLCRDGQRRNHYTALDAQAFRTAMGQETEEVAETERRIASGEIVGTEKVAEQDNETSRHGVTRWLSRRGEPPENLLCRDGQRRNFTSAALAALYLKRHETNAHERTDAVRRIQEEHLTSTWDLASEHGLKKSGPVNLWLKRHGAVLILLLGPNGRYRTYCEAQHAEAYRQAMTGPGPASGT